jgi:hypothetical protein
VSAPKPPAARVLPGRLHKASAELHQLSLEDLRRREAALEGELSGPKSANGAPPAGQA